MSSLVERLEAKKLEKDEPEGLTGGEVLEQAIKNLPSSAAQLASDITYPFLNPIDTAESLGSLGIGIVKLMIPDDSTEYDEDEEAVKAVGRFFADRYGSLEGFKRSIASDPLGVLSDISVVFTGGAALGAKAPGIAGKFAQTAGKVGEAIDPVLAGGKAISATATGIGKAAAPAFGLTTGAGTDAIRIAVEAGASAPEIQKMFLDNLRQNVSPEEIVPKALARFKETTQGTRGKFKADKKALKLESTPVEFKSITQAVNDFEKNFKFEGVSELSKQGQKKLSDLKRIIKTWQKNPKLHNAKGLDILKRRIDNEYPTVVRPGDSGVVVTQLRNVVKDKILEEVPEYGKVMKDYELAINIEKQFINELSLGKNKAAGTTLRKLQSALRNNVNTAYGNRLNMLNELDPNLVVEIGGQALSSVVPRGLGGLSAGTIAAVAPFTNPAALAALPFTSPRVVGELAFKIGEARKALQPLKGQTALDVARGARLTGEVMRADDVDDIELLKMLLEKSEQKDQLVDSSQVTSINKDATKLADEFDKEEDANNFNQGGIVNDNDENVAETIIRKLNFTFTPNDMQNELLQKQIVPLQRISKDAQGSKYKDQVFKKLENYLQNLESDMKQSKSISLRRLKNVVEREVFNKIDDSFSKDDEETKNQLQYAPQLFKKYIGLDDSDDAFQAREKAANKIVQTVINKNLNPVEVSNILLSHNKFSPKDSVPLSINKIASAVTDKEFERAGNSLKDAMLIKLFESDKNTKNVKANKYDKILTENEDVFDTLFTAEELSDLQAFKENVVPEITKKLIINPNKSKYLFTSALAKTGLLGDKTITSDKDSLKVARDSLKKLETPLIPKKQDDEVEPDILMAQNLATMETQAPVVEEEQTQDLVDLQSNIDNFNMPMLQQPNIDITESDVNQIQTPSPTILPSEIDREIAMRMQMQDNKGIAGLG